MTISLNARLAAVSLCIALSSVATQAVAADAFEVTSPGTPDGGTIDSSHAASVNNCGGGNQSPAVQWRNVPSGTRSFAVTLFDPDGAKGIGVIHWVLYGIPASMNAMAHGASAPPGSVSGINRTGQPGYYGPCPPIGDVPHHYVLQVYALDLAQDALPPNLNHDAFLAAATGHVLAASSTVLRYGR
ncbi:YbhB/YbcL family Raf kinase inhibitor-like protein [Paraburkholderia sp. C35]|uniref:YbhB/YbcL family Raf kinase inhibitor-like protein n=1 Tax=Paraburkholderia sp. C35 TaxID=2126993 RepID=UPI000D68EFC4|nr:YbhB/YbcL family Raf kinase inhibitor-like protein [Paraburkholderia sp. C35]